HAPVAEHPLDRVAARASSGEDLAHLALLPDVELALLPLGVGVERRVKATLWSPHLPQGPVERLLANAQPAVSPGHLPAVEVDARQPPGVRPAPLPAVEIDARQQRVVVEHLLEVGDEPGGVHGVAGEATAELVVD